MGDEEDEGNIVGKEYPGGRVGLNCRVIKEEEKVVVEEINHGFINDGYDDYLYEDSGIRNSKVRANISGVWWIILPVKTPTTAGAAKDQAAA